MSHPRETSPSSNSTITAELVAKTIAGISQIGYAQRTLQEAGYAAAIVANRITVDQAVEAQLVSTNGQGWWQVHAIDGTLPVWTVGAYCAEASNWIGCVE